MKSGRIILICRVKNLRPVKSLARLYCTNTAIPSSSPPSSSPSSSWLTQPIIKDDELEAAAMLDSQNSNSYLAHELLENKRIHYLSELQKYSANSHAVFTNSEFSLKYIQVYGFDVDYTLAHYSQHLHKYIYEQARDVLIKKLNYPTSLKGMNYDPGFGIRGLHGDSKNGLLMKIDTYNYIQPSSVYRGHSRVSVDEVCELYGGLHVPMHVMDNNPTTSKWKLTHFLDMFSLPEATLFADVSQYLLENNINYDPENLFQDVQTTIYNLHHSGQIHMEVASDLERYMLTHHHLSLFLQRLKNAGKQLFIITNSPFWFVNKILTRLLSSKQWHDLFDIIIVGARKPSFYSESNRPFRCLNTDSVTPTWTKVTELKPGKVYQQGNVKDLVEMMNWQRKGVLYFGDHVFSDLADPILQQGWKTGAIISELEDEIGCANSDQFKYNLSYMLALESMLKRHNMTEELVEEWKTERNNARLYLKEAHNVRFGSVFRTEKSPTYFSRRLASFANLYTSSLDNLLHYSLDHTFIPRRASLPHEPDLNFDL